MAYYTALITAWNSVTQPPAGVTGVGLSSSMTTAQKIVTVNNWTITGTIPSTMYFTGSQLANCINYTEFAAKTSAQQANIMSLCGNPGNLIGGSANTSFLPVGMILATFGSSSVTIANLTALAQATVTPWWQSVGYLAPITYNDCVAAGVT